MAPAMLLAVVSVAGVGVRVGAMAMMRSLEGARATPRGAAVVTRGLVSISRIILAILLLGVVFMPMSAIVMSAVVPALRG